ncbi:hypothetical protein [uncultured Flavobacterium sp.]|uniref:hypothetical protein n=1 Tax=uncultured Flavobacterium sp. TaxID=165435 RepID=UPI0030CA451E|tara:strand:- start:994 stop:1173 length:180 start_codon:yes stop_codon:yes gene_type:complete
MSTLAYYFSGLLSGISITSFFMGKEMYKMYVKNKIQNKQLKRMGDLKKEIEESVETDNL